MSLRRALVGVGLCGAIAAAAGIGVRATYGAHASVDEPQYLLTALSLAEDRSLDISDELDDERYRTFHEIALSRQTEPLADGSEISPHDPLLPLLLALPMEIGGWVGAKLLLALMNGLLGALLVWVVVRRFGVPVARSALVAGVFVASAPFAVYGQQVYPELPAALAVTVALAALCGARSPAALIALGTSVVALPWLSVKYVPVAAALAASALWLLAREGRRATATWVAGALGIAGLLYLLAHLAWYGGLTVYATGDHFVSTGQFGVVGTRVDLLGRSTRLIALLVDDKFGLVLWQPAFLLALPALGALARRRPPGSGALAAVASAGWLSATFIALTMQGWWWPGRQTVVVLPALVLAIAWWARADRRRVQIVGGLGVAGVVSYVWLLVEGLGREITWVVDFFDTSNPLYRVAASVTPDYLVPTTMTWILHAAWIAVAAALVALGYRNERSGGPGSYSVEPELEPLVVEPEPEPEPDPDDSEPSTSRTSPPSSLHAAPDSAATATSAASARFVPFRMSPPRSSR